MRRRVLRLLILILEKPPPHLVQKSMNCRSMDVFAKINLSPVTINKQHDVKHLENLYAYFLEE